MDAFSLLVGVVLGGALVWLALYLRRPSVANHRDLAAAFRSAAADALEANSRSFLHLASTTLERERAEAAHEVENRQAALENLVKPVHESLARVDAHLRTVEAERRERQGALTEQLRGLARSQDRLREETGRLVTALRRPSVRGRWGEIHLRRVVELAGMVEHCDFSEQPSAVNGDARLRPDLVVRLPGGKNVVVDAKTPLDSYLDSLDARDDEERRAALAGHARQVRERMSELSAKSYWQQFTPAPEFVVMFLPGETFLHAALEQDARLIERGAADRVLLATPTTLIALLRAVAYGWRQETLAESAREISDLGRELYGRLTTLAGHFDALGRGLTRSVKAYNRAVGSFESRVLVSARRFGELGVDAEEDLDTPQSVDAVARKVSAPERPDPAGPAEPRNPPN